MRRLHVLVVMEDTLLAEALVGQLSSHPQLQLSVCAAATPPAELLKKSQGFAADIFLLDRHPSGELLSLLADQRPLRLAVVRPEEKVVTIYDTANGRSQASFREVQEIKDLLPLLGYAEEMLEPQSLRDQEGRAMPYARITRLYPQPGREEEAQRMLESYLAWLKERPGFLLGLCLAPTEQGHGIARVTVWESEGWADTTALSEHALAIRSQLMVMTRDQTLHEEEFVVRLLQMPARPRITHRGRAPGTSP